MLCKWAPQRATAIRKASMKIQICGVYEKLSIQEHTTDQELSEKWEAQWYTLVVLALRHGKEDPEVAWDYRVRPYPEGRDWRDPSREEPLLSKLDAVFSVLQLWSQHCHGEMADRDRPAQKVKCQLASLKHAARQKWQGSTDARTLSYDFLTCPMVYAYTQKHTPHTLQ